MKKSQRQFGKQVIGHTSDSSFLGGEQKNVTQWQELALPVEDLAQSLAVQREREWEGVITAYKEDKRQFYVNG